MRRIEIGEQLSDFSECIVIVRLKLPTTVHIALTYPINLWLQKLNHELG
jgi:hypothetical protein